MSPHALIAWSGWAAFAVDSYGELVLFNVVGSVTGELADRLRRERDRLRHSYGAVEAAYQQLEASTAERIVAERLTTEGRVAMNVAHEIRTPLGSILGCFEILEADYPSRHPRREFLDLLKAEIGRADQVVRALLDVAEPARPHIG
jgi:signal transduction histidine kinase